MSPHSTVHPAGRLVVGSFEHAEWVRAQEMARLTPAQRVKIVCSMNEINRRVKAARKAGRKAS